MHNMVYFLTSILKMESVQLLNAELFIIKYRLEVLNVLSARVSGKQCSNEVFIDVGEKYIDFVHPNLAKMHTDLCFCFCFSLKR